MNIEIPVTSNSMPINDCSQLGILVPYIIDADNEHEETNILYHKEILLLSLKNPENPDTSPMTHAKIINSIVTNQ